MVSGSELPDTILVPADTGHITGAFLILRRQSDGNRGTLGRTLSKSMRI